MTRIFLMAMAMTCAGEALAYSKAAEYLIEEQIKAGCGDLGGTFISVDERDLTNDGKPDLIIDHGNLRCNGERSTSETCGAAHCDILIYVRRGAILKLEESFMSIGHDVENDSAPPNIQATGFEYQEHTIRWNGRKFAKGSAFREPGTDQWRYGPGYAIGIAARYGTQEGAIGLACSPSGSPAVSIRVSSSMVPGNETDGLINVIFADLRDSTLNAAWPLKFDSYYESAMEPGCGELDRWRTTSDLFIVRGHGKTEAIGLDLHLTTITQGGNAIPLRTVEDLAKLKNVRRVPLQGAGKAIDDLLRLCPAIKAAQESACRRPPQ